MRSFVDFIRFQFSCNVLQIMQGLSSPSIPKRYLQHEKEALITLFENAVAQLRNVPPNEAGSCK